MENLRLLRKEDAGAVAELYRETYGDNRPIDAEEVASWVTSDELKPDWLRVLEIDGRIVGYGDIWIDKGEMAVEVAAPGHWSTFFDWFEERARSEGVSPVRAFVPKDHELAEILSKRGYQNWRSAYTMQIELGEQPPDVPAVPEGFEFRDFQDSDTEMVRLAMNEAFERDPFFYPATPGHFQDFYRGQRGFDHSLWVLAFAGEDLAGFILSFTERSGDKELGWVASLGVLAPWRRRGLGDALLRTSFHRLHQRGLRKIGLGVDASNETNALHLYERAGMEILNQADSWALDI
ncbi:MAG: GNAT family N-acetyltransferase [Actinomycetota bacterium]